MDRERSRIESLERRVRHLERQLARLEAEAPAETATRHRSRPGLSRSARAAARARPVERSRLPRPRRSPHSCRRPGPSRGRRPSPPVVPPTTPACVRSGGRAASASSSDAWSATTARTPISLKDLEERFAGRALAWIGGIALVAAAIFFLSLAFSRGWITEPMRVAIGLDRGHRRVRCRGGPAGPQEPAGGQRPRRCRPGHRVRVAVRGHPPVRPASPRGRPRGSARRRDRGGGRRRPLRRAERRRLRAHRRADRAAAHGRVAHAPDAPVRRRHPGGHRRRSRSSARGAGCRRWPSCWRPRSWPAGWRATPTRPRRSSR